MVTLADPSLLIGEVMIVVCRAKRVSLVLCLGIAAVLTACRAPSGPVPTSVKEEPTLSSAEGYPAPGNGPQGDPAATPSGVFQTPEVNTALPTPEAGKAVLGGSLYSFTTKMLVAGTLLYLTPAVGPDKNSVPPIISGPDDSNGDIRGQSDSGGQFVITSIPPGNYYLVVAAPLNWSLGMAASGDVTPMLISLVPDESLSVGVVYLSWP